MRLGVAYFHSPDSPEASTLTAYDGRAFATLDDWTQLDDATTWFTNVNRAALAGAKLAGVPHIKDTKFWSVPFAGMLKELLLDSQASDEDGRQKIVIRMHDVYYKVLSRLSKHFDRVDVRASTELVGEIEKQVALPSTDTQLSASELEIFNEAYTINTSVPGEQIAATNKIVNLNYPRSIYAHHMLQQIIPAGQWRRILKKTPVIGALLSTKDQGDLTDILGSTVKHKCILLKVALVERHKNQSLRVIRLDNPGGTWMTGIETVELAARAKIKIVDGFYCDEITTGYDMLNEIDRESPTFLQMVSPAYGYFLTEMVRALLGKTVSGSDGVEYHATAATYLKAHDRVLCLQAADAIIERGYDVSNYGNNIVTISVPEEYIETLLELGYEKGLIARMHEGAELVSEAAMKAEPTENVEHEDDYDIAPRPLNDHP